MWNLKQAPGSELSAEPDAGLELTNCEIMTRAETKSQTPNPGAPSFKFF